MSFYISLSAFFIMLLFIYVFFSKEREKNAETIVYSKLLIITAIGLFLEIITGIWFNFYDVNKFAFLCRFISKIASSFYAVWSILFLNYIVNTCKYDEKNNLRFNIVIIIIFLVIILLPIDLIHSSNGSIVPSGLSIVFTYIVCFIVAIIDTVYCIKYRKKISKSI